MGIIFAVIASILYGIEPTFAEIILEKGVNSLDLLLITSFLSALISLLTCILTKSTIKVNKNEIIPLICCGILFFLTNLFLSLSYQRIPVGFATMLHFSYPTMVFLICVLLYHEETTFLNVIGVIICLFGLFLISDNVSSYDSTGIFTALLSAVFYSSYLLVIDKSQVSKVQSYPLIFHISLVGGITALFIKMFFQKEVTFNISTLNILIPLFLLVATLLFFANFLLNKSIKILGSNKASRFTVVEPLTSLVFSVLVFNYSIPFNSIIGSVLIIISLAIAVKS